MTNSRPGRLLIFEGLDGAGKSTQVQLLAGWLREHGQQVLITAEPGGTPLGKQLEQLLKHGRGEAPSARAEALLFFAARADHVDRVLRPALAAGTWVLCDRFSFSTLAYQGWGHGLDVDALAAADAYARDGLQPDRVFYFDVPDSVLDARRQGRPADRIEARPEAYRDRVRAGFEALVARSPELALTIPADGSPEAIQATLRASLEGWL